MTHDAERQNLEAKIAAACRNLERVLEQKSDDYYSYTQEQASEVFGVQTYRIWAAWAILTNRLPINGGTK